MFLLYHINNKKHENITGLGEKEEEVKNLNETKKNLQKEIQTKISEIKDNNINENINNINEIRKVNPFTKICNIDGKLCIGKSEFKKSSDLKIDTNLIKTQQIEHNSYNNYNNYNIDNMIYTNFDNFNKFNSFIQNLNSTIDNKIDNKKYLGVNFFNPNDTKMFDTSANFIKNLPTYFKIQPGSLFGYNIGSLDSLKPSLFASGKVQAKTTTYPKYDSTLTTIGLGYTGFHFNQYTRTDIPSENSFLKGIEINTSQIKKDGPYNTLILNIDCSGNNTNSSLVLYSYDETKEPKYTIFGNYAVNFNYDNIYNKTYFEKLYIPIPENYTGKLMLNTPLQTTDISNSIIISEFGFSENIYNYLKVYSNMFNLNTDINLGPNFNKKFPPGISHSVFTIKPNTVESSSSRNNNTITNKIVVQSVEIKHLITTPPTPPINYNLRIPIINSGKNKILSISTFFSNMLDLYIYIDLNPDPIKLNRIDNMVGYIDKINKRIMNLLFFIPKKYINHNFINIRFNLNVTPGKVITENITDISTFDEIL